MLYVYRGDDPRFVGLKRIRIDTNTMRVEEPDNELLQLLKTRDKYLNR